MGYTMGRIIYGETNTKYVGIVSRVHNVFHASVYNIGGLHCRSQYFCCMENNVHLRDLHQGEIQFIHIQPKWF